VIITAKPFIKWAGGKSQILPEIRSKYPVEIKKYAEPFVGGGAVLFDILNSYIPESVYISDINRELILTYTVVRDNLQELIEHLRNLEDEYRSITENARKQIYYMNRKRFNTLKKDSNNSIELAALFIFLNKTCFNGLYRVNSHGEYNVPQGSYKNPAICDEDNLQAVSAKLQDVTIVCADYKKSRSFIDRDTFAYFDPPYRPLTATASFTAYTNGGFSDKEQAELARFIDEMSERGAYVLASNSDPHNADETDDFFDELYSRHNIIRITACRMINSVGTGRGRVNELLIANG
jgi:DNA adenine methylase